MVRSSWGRFSCIRFIKSRNLVRVRAVVAICWRKLAMMDYNRGERGRGLCGTSFLLNRPELSRKNRALVERFVMLGQRIHHGHRLGNDVAGQRSISQVPCVLLAILQRPVQELLQCTRAGGGNTRTGHINPGETGHGVRVLARSGGHIQAKVERKGILQGDTGGRNTSRSGLNEMPGGVLDSAVAEIQFVNKTEVDITYGARR